MADAKTDNTIWLPMVYMIYHAWFACKLDCDLSWNELFDLQLSVTDAEGYTLTSPPDEKQGPSKQKLRNTRRHWARRERQMFLRIKQQLDIDIAKSMEPDTKSTPKKTKSKPRSTKVCAKDHYRAQVFPPSTGYHTFADCGQQSIREYTPDDIDISIVHNRQADKRFTQRKISCRRSAFKSDCAYKHVINRSKPRLQFNSQSTSWNKRYAVISLDAVGSGVSDTESSSKRCLVDSLAALGVPLTVHGDGPFRALADGNKWLRELGLHLEPVPVRGITQGSYIKWCDHHFTAVTVDSSVTLIDQGISTQYRCIGDIGRPDEHKWFRLCVPTKDDGIRTAACSLQPTVELLNRKRSVAMISRQIILDQHRCCLMSTSSSSQTFASRIQLNRAKAMRIRSESLHRPLLPLKWPVIQPPTWPTDFSTKPFLQRVDFLSNLNHHARDDRIQFFDETHTYLIDGQKSIGSVTGLVHSFAADFKGDEIAMKMQHGRNWPRPGYIHKTLTENAKAQLSVVKEATP